MLKKAKKLKKIRAYPLHLNIILALLVNATIGNKVNNKKINPKVGYKSSGVEIKSIDLFNFKLLIIIFPN